MNSKEMIRCLSGNIKLNEFHEICENLVTFVNVKSTYHIDEDVVANYTLQNEFKSSTRDWIGIFPRNWLNLQQYLTFEYTTSPSPNVTKNHLNRTITFPRIFHREASFRVEYQFVYVSKGIQIMAMSKCFCFIPSRCNQPLQCCPLASKSYPLIDVLSNSIMNDKEFGLNTEKTLGTEIPAKITLPQDFLPKCRYCHRQICGTKIDTLRGDFLAAFSDSLLNRVHRLERDVSFAENALKNAKGARENLAKRLCAYEAFVAEMLGSIAIRGFVKITDEKGKEILLQRVNEQDRLGNVDSEKIYALQEEIVALKSLLGKQQQTITELNEQRKLNILQKERITFIDREVQTYSDLLESAALDKTVTRETVEDSREKELSNTILKAKHDENFIFESKTHSSGIDRSDSLKYLSEENDQAKNVTKVVPRVLKVLKPAGILLQGKDVKFAIVRFP